MPQINPLKYYLTISFNNQNKMLDLIIITGASTGIGRSIAQKCSNSCKTMIGISSSNKIYHNEFDENCNYIPMKLDLADYRNVYKNLSCLDYSKITSIGIVLCGAQLGKCGGLLEADLEDWENLYKCNLLGNLAVVKACTLIITRVKTRIVFLGGGGAAFNYESFSNYALTKAATIRAAENLSIELSKINNDISIVSLAPGAVETAILAQVKAHGGEIRTPTDISEPTSFVYKFLNDELDSKTLNGRFLHVRDDLEKIDFSNPDICKLRRIEWR